MNEDRKEYFVKTGKTVEEMINLVQEGFEYVTEIKGVHI